MIYSYNNDKTVRNVNYSSKLCLSSDDGDDVIVKRLIVGSAGSPVGHHSHYSLRNYSPHRALINPFAPRRLHLKVTSNRRRWTHAFPTGQIAASFNFSHRTTMKISVFTFLCILVILIVDSLGFCRHMANNIEHSEMYSSSSIVLIVIDKHLRQNYFDVEECMHRSQILIESSQTTNDKITIFTPFLCRKRGDV